jgi:hypothetical protein
MLYREIIAVCSQIHTEHTNTLCCPHSVFVCVMEFVNVRRGGTYNNHLAVKGQCGLALTERCQCQSVILFTLQTISCYWWKNKI